MTRTIRKTDIETFKALASLSPDTSLHLEARHPVSFDQESYGKKWIGEVQDRPLPGLVADACLLEAPTPRRMKAVPLWQFPEALATSAWPPVLFVCGALRSGTTLFRLMLDAHRDIANPGEMDFLFDHLRKDSSHPTGWRYDLQALRNDRIFRASCLDIPESDGLDLLQAFLRQLKEKTCDRILSINLHRHVARAAEILPDARFLHILRDPRDVARSSTQMGWAGTLYHGVAHWIATERDWDAAGIAQDRVLTLRYEDLILEPKRHLREVCRFAGCDFDPAMLNYHEGTSYGAPDPALIFQWKRKADTREIRQLESRASDLMARRGYAPTGPAKPLGPLARARLSLHNKLAVWRFGMKRFGPALFLGEKISRWLRLTPVQIRLQRRIDRIVTEKYLK